MNKHTWKTYAFWIFLTEAVGALAGWLTRADVQQYTAEVLQPDWAPPNIVFPIVWTILYALMGIGAARIDLSPASADRTRSLRIYFVQLAVNFFWSLIFFHWQAYGFALAWLCLLWVLILAMILSFRKVDKLAAWLQLPYLLWVSFAGILNWAVWTLNR